MLESDKPVGKWLRLQYERQAVHDDFDLSMEVMGRARDAFRILRRDQLLGLRLKEWNHLEAMSLGSGYLG